MLKDLFVPVTGATTDDAMLEVAGALATAHGARLVVAVSAPVPAPMATPWGIAPNAVVAELLEDVVREAEQRAAVLRKRLASHEGAWDVQVDGARYLDPPQALAMNARYADLAVLARPAGKDAGIARAFFNAFLFESGRPVLVVPAASKPKRFRKLLLAWKPTRESARAIHDAIDAFAPESVEVLVVDPAVGDLVETEPGVDIAAHLARHGLATHVSTRESKSKSVATTVLLHAAETGADLVVAGGYGHARLREWVLGGATRDLLESSEIPVLFAR